MSVSPTNGISKLTVEDGELNGAGANAAAAGAIAIAAATDAVHGDAGGVGGSQTAPDAPTRPRGFRGTKSLCGVCQKRESSYKCPHCAIAYCSVACSHVHRVIHPADSLPPKPPQPVRSGGAHPPRPAQKQSQQASHPFSVLDDSPELRRLFKKYPSLPAALEGIHEATLPPKNAPTGIHAMIDATRSKKQEPWSPDVGLRRGRAALRKARMDPGEDGDGVREYCDLVRYLLSRSDSDGKVNDMVQHEVVQGDVKLIRNLQRQEWTD
ncbi:hypothetical protein RB595_004038 [Gaeumannomyces hyphopodioides]